MKKFCRNFLFLKERWWFLRVFFLFSAPNHALLACRLSMGVATGTQTNSEGPFVLPDLNGKT